MALTKTPICDFGKKADNFELKSIDNKIIRYLTVKYEKLDLKKIKLTKKRQKI